MTISKFKYLISISESDKPDAALLAREGYNYFTKIDNQMIREKLIDWLSENNIEYIIGEDGHFDINCQDRDSAYKTNRAIFNMSKPVVRDNQEVKEMSEKKSSINKIKDKIKKLKPANQAAISAAKKTGAGPHSLDPRKTDEFDRKTKHKKKPIEEGYEIGSIVYVNGKQGTIKISNGPNGTVGVMMEGKLKMVKSSDVNLKENVIGLTKISPLFRLRELAGMPPEPENSMISQDDTYEVDEPETLDLDDTNELEVEPDDLNSIDIGEPIINTPVANVSSIGTKQSEAMSAIDDFLNNIQNQLSDIRLSEYKPLLARLQDLTTQVQMMGRNYLGERRKK